MAIADARPNPQLPVWLAKIPPASRPAGREKVAGLTCDVYDVPGGRLWIWKGILLKQDESFGAMHRLREAVAVDSSPAFPPGYFELAPEMRIRERDRREPNPAGRGARELDRDVNSRGSENRRAAKARTSR
jgi:hypothetical protein